VTLIEHKLDKNASNGLTDNVAALFLTCSKFFQLLKSNIYKKMLNNYAVFCVKKNLIYLWTWSVYMKYMKNFFYYTLWMLYFQIFQS